MTLRSKIFLATVAATFIGIAGLALTASLTQARQNTQNTDNGASSYAAMSSQNGEQAAQVSTNSSTQQSAQTSNSQTSSAGRQQVIADPPEAFGPAQPIKGVNLTPQDRQAAQELRDFLEQQGFSDVQLNSQYYDATLVLQVLGIFKGYPDGTARLSQTMSRSQAAAILNRTFGFSLYTSTNRVFGDVPAGSANEKAINALYWAGVTNGCTASPRNYCPNDTITRRQFATLLGKALGAPSTASGWVFDDVSQTDSAYPYIAYLKSNGIVNGCVDRKFCPNDPITRGQAVVMITRLFLGENIYPYTNL